MSTPDGHHDLEVASRAFDASAKRGKAGTPPDLATFLGQLSFLLTIGYLTPKQGQALLDWFNSSGMNKLEPLPGPKRGPSPSMYEILSTQIHFGTPEPVRDFQINGLPPGVVLASDIGDFFSGLLGAVGDLIGTVLEGVGDVLDSGTALLQAATALVHELHEDVVLAP